MKRLLATIAAASFFFSAFSQEVTLIVNDGIGKQELRESIGHNISSLLTSFNRANRDKTALDLNGVQIVEDAVPSVQVLWRNMPFTCTERQIVERALMTADGYQLRNIPIEVKAPGAGRSAYQELVIDTDKTGTITRVNLAIQNHLYRKIISEGTDVTDLRYRQMILDYVEQFRTAYNRKDIDFLENVFSDDALIITGRVITRKSGDRVAVMKGEREIIYKKQTKREYLNRLKNYVFPSASYIRVNFRDIRVSKHPSIKGYYGVTLRQGYESSNYSDDGYLFMIWDFRDETHPQIHVRTWQPYWMDEARTQKIDESKVFGINDFIIE